MSSTLKTILISIFAASVVIGAATLIFALNGDLFWGGAWFLLIASLLTLISRRLHHTKSRVLWYLAAAALGLLWLLVNSTALRLIVENINTNPYGEYVIAQMKVRLELSVFMLKLISQAWLTDLRLFIVFLLFLFNRLIFPTLYKIVASRLPHSLFEFCLHTGKTVKADLIDYFSHSLALILINSLLWFLATFLLRFDNFIILTLIMVASMLTPRLGLFLTAALSVIYVESGLFMLQLGGIFIAAASVWFIDHTLFSKQAPDLAMRQIALLAAAMACGYFLFSFPGLFAAGPLLIISTTIGTHASRDWDLIHRRDKTLLVSNRKNSS